MSQHNSTLTAVPGLRVGHATDLEHATGCTVVLCPPAGCIAGVDVRGSAPGTRETDLLRPGQLVERAQCHPAGGRIRLWAGGRRWRHALP